MALQQLLRRGPRPVQLFEDSRTVPLFPWLSAAAIGALLSACVALVYLAGGTAGSLPHSLYIPIAAAAYLFGLPGSIVTALVAGIALGPLMPQSVHGGEVQSLINWLSRLGFYLIAAAAMGAIAMRLDKRRVRLEEAVAAVEETHAATLKAFSAVVEVHDGPTGEHCERVAANARTLGLALGLDNGELDQLYWAGILHDVGKVAVPARIIQKPGALTDEEYEQIKRHPSFGADLLRTITAAFDAVAQGVESHHERWDGSGYPKGLKEEQIPLFGRVLAIVDVFEAMTSDRPYRRAVAPEEALAMLRAGAGTMYEWKLVALYESLYWDGKVLIAGDDRSGLATDARLTTWLTRVEA